MSKVNTRLRVRCSNINCRRICKTRQLKFDLDCTFCKKRIKKGITRLYTVKEYDKSNHVDVLTYLVVKAPTGGIWS